MVQGILVSSAVHITLILLAFALTLFKGGPGGQQGNAEDGAGKDNGIFHDIVKKKEDAPVEVTIVEEKKPEEGLSRAPIQEESDGLRECVGSNWYGGIGIVHTRGDGTITDVVQGYPADKAGIIPGDMLLSEDNIQGKPGTEIVVKVLRNGRVLSFTIIREKICTEQ